METETSRTCSMAPPLKWPMPLASTTVPRAGAPASITVLPSTVTGSATVAEKSWPAWLWLELRVSPSLTVMWVPSGMTSARSSATGLVLSVPLGAPAAALVPPVLPGLLLLEAGFEAGFEADTSDLLQLVSRKRTRAAMGSKRKAFTSTSRYCDSLTGRDQQATARLDHGHSHERAATPLMQ